MDSQKLERIEAYLNGSLSEQATRDFERELADNWTLAAEVKEYARIIQGIKELHFRELLEQAQRERVKAPQSLWRNPFWAIAAAALILLSLLWMFFPEEKENEIAAINPIELDPGLPTTLGATSSLDFDEGMNRYKLKSYESARAYWRPLLINNPQNDSLLFFLAQIDLADQSLPDAISKFEVILNQPQSIFYQKSQWYLALALLKNGQSEPSTTLLKEIQSERGTFASKAKALLDELNSP